MEDFKRRVYEVVEVSSMGDKSSRAYDIMMNTAIIVSLIPMTFKKDMHSWRRKEHDLGTC